MTGPSQPGRPARSPVILVPSAASAMFVTRPTAGSPGHAFGSLCPSLITGAPTDGHCAASTAAARSSAVKGASARARAAGLGGGEGGARGGGGGERGGSPWGAGARTSPAWGAGTEPSTAAGILGVAAPIPPPATAGAAAATLPSQEALIFAF